MCCVVVVGGVGMCMCVYIPIAVVCGISGGAGGIYVVCV